MTDYTTEERKLAKEVKSFLKKLDFPEGTELPVSEVNSKSKTQKREINKEHISNKNKEEKLFSKSKGKQPHLESSTDGKPVFNEMEYKWYELLSSLHTVKGGINVIHKKRKAEIEDARAKAENLLKREIANFTKRNDRDSELHNIERVIREGTLSDKIAGMALKISMSPIHNLDLVDRLLVMVEKKGKRESKLAGEALYDLFLKRLLPNTRHLQPFDRRPLSKAKVSEMHMILWLVEDTLKSQYLRFVRALESLTYDNLIHVKKFAIDTIFGLLKECCEQEQLLLFILVNKLGDTERKINSHVVYLLHKLVNAHPNMRLTIVKEVEQYLLMSKQTNKDAELAQKLISIYIRLFESVLAGNHSTIRANVESVSSRTKLLSALLTGVNRAFPYASGGEKDLEKQIDILFKISHTGSFNTSTQALQLLFHIMRSKEMASDRFYRALYAHLLSSEIFKSSKQTLLLNLVYKALKADSNMNRCRAFIKRLLQIALMSSAQFAAGVLYLISSLMIEKPELREMLNSTCDTTQNKHNMVEEGEERISSNGPQLFIVGTESSNYKSSDPFPHFIDNYDPSKRDPCFAGTPKGTIAWEMELLYKHYHPSVRSFVDSLLNDETHVIKYSGDPLRDFSNAAFLDRFVYRNPRKRDIESIREKSVFGLNGRARRKGKAAIVSAVNSPEFLLQQSDAIDSADKFFFFYFQHKASLQGRSLVEDMKIAREKERALKNRAKNPFAEFEEDEEEEAFAQELAEKLLRESAGGAKVDEEWEQFIDFDYDSDNETTKDVIKKARRVSSTAKDSNFVKVEGGEFDETSSDEGLSLLNSKKVKRKQERSLFVSAEDFEPDFKSKSNRKRQPRNRQKMH